MTNLENLEKEIESIKNRNRRVEKDKAWETSWTRKAAIAVSTYIVVLIFFLIAKVEKPFIGALVPSIAFLLSTASIEILKNWWLNKSRK